jgi:hypothetical protein
MQSSGRASATYEELLLTIRTPNVLSRHCLGKSEFVSKLVFHSLFKWAPRLLYCKNSVLNFSVLREGVYADIVKCASSLRVFV